MGLITSFETDTSLFILQDLKPLGELGEDLRTGRLIDRELNLFLLQAFWVILLVEYGLNLYVSPELCA
jgi:hypothetical protein